MSENKEGYKSDLGYKLIMTAIVEKNEHKLVFG